MTNVLVKKTKIDTWGNSNAIRLPKMLLRAVNLAGGQEVDILADIQNQQITIKKTKSRKTLEELFENYEGTYDCTSFKWSIPTTFNYVK